MGEVSRGHVAAALVARGVRPDRAALYADAFVEYRAAAANIAREGTIVLHPKTGNPIENPYLGIRDRARRTLERMRGVNGGFLWPEAE